MIKISRYILVIASTVVANYAFSHHSFAVHFVPDEIITVSGVVTEFTFKNPHGLVYLTVTDASGEEEAWRAETNSPNLLRRRGWTSDSIQAGDQVTIDGYPTRDGSPYVRINRLSFPDGRELIGQGRLLSDPSDQD